MTWVVTQLGLALFLVPQILPVAGLIAYDCHDDTSELSTISLRDVAECPKPELSYKSERLSVTVLQRNDIKLTRVQTCLIEVTRIITHCGMHSHSSMVAGGLSSYVHRVGAEECRDIHRYKTFTINHQTVGNVAPNSSTQTSVTLLGQIDGNGKCQGTSYQEKGQSWNDVVITATVNIQVTDYLAMVKLDDNEISLNGKLTCPFLPGYCFDAITGETIWDSIVTDKCEGLFSPIYEGEADQVTNIKTMEKYVVVEQEGKIFALTMIKKNTVCGTEVWQTEHPKILLMDKAQPTTKSALLPQNTDLTAYVNSKFLYVEQAYKRALEQVYIDTIHRRCLLQRELLKTRLLMAPLLPDAISQLVKDQEGYVGRVLGEVLYIIKCVPKIVKIRRSDRCYNELPIEVNNQSKFMAPNTRIIQNVAEEIDCNSMTPPLYYINSEWIGMAPLVTVKHKPQELNADAAPLIHFKPIMPLGEQGLYTQEEASQVQRILTFGSERKAVENLIARRVVGLDTESQGVSTLQMFNPKELQDLAKSTIKQLWGWFSDLGTFMSGILGFYIIFRLAKYILGVIINGFHLYKTFGGGIKLLACVWNTLTMWLIHRYHSERPRRATSQPDVEAVLVEPAIPLTHFDNSSFMPRPAPRRNHQLAKSQPNLYENMQPPHPSKKFSSCSTTTLVQPYSLIPSAPHWAETVEEN